MTTHTETSVPGVLILEDGKEFEGYLFGAPISLDDIRNRPRNKDFAYGEVVFNTSMTGYQEILTDPSYYGQLICMTTPHIGNTGVNEEDPESSQAWCSGFIVHDICHQASNWRSQGNLENYLRQNGIPGLYGVNTRSLTRHIRTEGALRGVILPASERHQAKILLGYLPSFEGRDLIHEVTTSKPYVWKKLKNPKYRIVALDFGIKWNLLKSLEQRGCEVEVLPAHATASEILSRKPDGIFLSNGPGDPKAAPYAAETVKGVLGKAPLFGVCMGHQILALALGAKTYKLKFGHRGGNQPVLDRSSGHVEISSHNHGYAVDAATLPASAEVTHINLNDKTVEGIEVKGAQAFSVQYHPEACPGPHDSAALFDRFIAAMEAHHTLK